MESTALVKKTNSLPSANDEYVARYLENEASSAIAGKLVKFSKQGHFVISESAERIPESTRWIALCSEAAVGWIKFDREEGGPPERRMGLLFQGFTMPLRTELDDLDETLWPAGLNGEPEDPWQHQIAIVLQNETTGELITFTTTSKTGRRAVSTLLQTYRRNLKTYPGTLPVVQLVGGSFKHEKFGDVAVPVFKVVGKTGVENAARPDEHGLPHDDLPF